MEAALISAVSKINEPVFISLDTKGHRMREVGISILDTCILKDATSSSDISMFVASHHYRTWKCEATEQDRPFMFGRLVQI